ncbi:MAG: FIST N-terminal domain-containing protein [Burkholderiaceae bacterium]
MTQFPMAHGSSHSAQSAVQALCEQFGEQVAAQRQQCLGLFYLNRAASTQSDLVLKELNDRYPGVQWSGAVADAVIAGELELGSEPAITAMLLPLPKHSWQSFSGNRPIGEKIHTALVHADPMAPDLPGLIDELAQRTETGYLFGGLTLGDPQIVGQFSDGEPIRDVLSGVGFTENIRLLSRVTQGCSPFASEHVITSCNANYVQTLDNEPALDVMLRDLGVDESVRQSTDGDEILQAMSGKRLANGLLVGLNDAVQDRRLGFGDYMVRNLIGIDPQSRLIAIGAEPADGDRLVFCTRDREAARTDLIRVCTELRDEVESESLSIRGAHFVSCVARGESLFGAVGAETALLRHNLGDVPTIGFYANGEIARERVYAYTGVLTLFVEANNPA